MANTTSQERDGLKKIIDFSRLIGIGLILFNIYYFCYDFFIHIGIVHPQVEEILFVKIGSGMTFFTSVYFTLIGALIFVGLYCWAVSVKRTEDYKIFNIKIKISKQKGAAYVAAGVLIILISPIFLKIEQPEIKILFYSLFLLLGFLSLLFGSDMVHRCMDNDGFVDDPFNEIQESAFPQMEKLLENEYSVNLPTKYRYKGELRNGWINIVNPFRASSVIGTPGSGKSFAFVNEFIRQHLRKGFTMYCYDFKFPDLSKIVYNNMIWNLDKYDVKPKFYVINFDDPRYSHRCNPIDATFLNDITDAYDSAYTFMLNLNKTWIQKQGDFFVESPINFFTAAIWYLRSVEGGKYCTLPHAIEWVSQSYSKTIPIMTTYSDLRNYMAPFFNAWEAGAQDQLQGQLASIQTAVTRIISKQLYWVLSGNDFTLDLNNPDEPKVLCIGNNPEKKDIYGSVLGLFNGRIVKVVNKQKKRKLSFIIDELPTIYFRGLDNLIATARSNKVAVLLGFQDYSQLNRDYGDKEAKAIINTIGNTFSGQVQGETAEALAKKFGKNKQIKKSINTSDESTSVNLSEQNEMMIPASKIAALSQGNFVGSVADDFGQEINQKIFHAQVMIDINAVKKEEKAYRPLPQIYNFNDMKVVNRIKDLIISEKDINNPTFLQHETFSSFNANGKTPLEKQKMINSAIRVLINELKGQPGTIDFLRKIDNIQQERMNEILTANSEQIRNDIENLIKKEMEKIQNDPQFEDIKSRIDSLL